MLVRALGGPTYSFTAHGPEEFDKPEGLKLGLKVEIRVKGKDRGQLILAFESNDDFERLLESLRK